MNANNASPQEPDVSSRRRHRGRKWAGLALTVVVLAIVLLVAAKWWIVPAVARWQLEAQLGDYWDGRAEFAELDFNYLGPIRVTGIVLADRQGRHWAEIDSLEVVLSGMPFDPVLTGLDVQEVRLTSWFENGELLRPWKIPPEKEEKEPSRRVDLRDVSIQNVSFAVADVRGSRQRWEDLDIDIHKRDGEYLVNVRRNQTDANQQFRVSGRLAEGTLQGSLDVLIRHPLHKPRVDEVLRIVTGRDGYTARGRLDVEVRAEGDFDDTENLKITGPVKITKAGFYDPQGKIFDDIDLNGEWDANAPAPTFRAYSYDADFSQGGKLSGDGRIGLTPEGPQPLSYDTRVAFWDIDLAALVNRLQGREILTEGFARKGAVELKGRGGDFDALSGRGTLLLDDITPSLIGSNGKNPYGDWVIVEVFGRMFKLLGQSTTAVTGGNDVEAEFTLEGTRVIFQKLRVGNRALALDTREGSWIDWRDEYVDALVYGVLLKDMRSLLESIPLVSLAVKAASNLSGFRVQGHFDDPPTQLVQQVALSEVSEGTVSFLKGVSEAGGDLSQQTSDAFQSFFKTLQGE
jgi:hypothetical protein